MQHTNQMASAYVTGNIFHLIRITFLFCSTPVKSCSGRNFFFVDNLIVQLCSCIIIRKFMSLSGHFSRLKTPMYKNRYIRIHSTTYTCKIRKIYHIHVQNVP